MHFKIAVKHLVMSSDVLTPAVLLIVEDKVYLQEIT